MVPQKDGFLDVVEPRCQPEVQPGRLLRRPPKKARSDLIPDINQEETFAVPKGDQELKDPNEHNLSLHTNSRDFQAAAYLDTIQTNDLSRPNKSLTIKQRFLMLA